MKKSILPWLFAVIILFFLLVLSVVLGFTGFYFSISYVEAPADLHVGETVSIGVEPNQSNVVSMTFDGAYLPDELIPQTIQINAIDLNTDVRIRVRAEVFGIEENLEFDFVTTEHFEKAEDGYYYFDEVLRGGNKITFSNYLIMPEYSETISREKYILSIIVESLETKYDEQNIWGKVA